MSSSIKRVVYFLKGYLTAKFSRYRTRANILIKQKKLFNHFKNRVLTQSPFYHNYVLKDLEEFPIIDKPFFVSNFNTINTQKLDGDECLKIAHHAEESRNFRSKHQGFSIGLSSGTSGRRGMFVTSDYEQAQWAGYIVGKILPLTIKKQKVAFLLRSNNNLYESSQGKLINFRFFDLLKPIKEIIDELDFFSPDILIAPAQILKVIAGSNINIKPNRIISVAEVLEKQDQSFIEQKFLVRVDQIYQCTEGFLASTCSNGSIHMNEDTLIIEKDWVDKKTGRFSPIITDLKRVTQPVVRYRLDDVLIENKIPCACGSSFLRIDSIEGRHDDILWYPNSLTNELVAIFPDLLRRTMLLVQKYYHDYRIIQDRHYINIYLKKNKTNGAESIVEKELLSLFMKLDTTTPVIVFNSWCDENLTEKCRRIKCNEKPKLMSPIDQNQKKMPIANI